ncbi:polyketide cyclase/dehydrase and lipid transport [Leptospira fainei serovar Hurstbridge str. BUT 6]|uniref:Polyketide cyclase/dehydrase and lipid transport n=1 Tax=Leptospira fainei serovar Hurstbridge str. BUT 6 TaxID=1193011 RepID=S3UY96_9LEPT|nr:SRPBCC family protein [Leptospira fainei]EPG73339.1 polyketide cyclase/dehydrase and lipid transport [Leptospira fainei serovar Hurstbridge str. BUT 6]
MLTTTIAFTVPSPLAKAFNYVSDLENLPEWESYILECKRVPGTNKYELKVGIGFWKLTSCYNLEEERYPTRLVITKENRFLQLRDTYTFYPDPKGTDTDTKIVFTNRFRIKRLGCLLNVWAHRKIRDRICKDMRSLQETLSQGKTIRSRSFQVIKS